MCGGPQTFWRSGAAEQVASVRATLVAAMGLQAFQGFAWPRLGVSFSPPNAAAAISLSSVGYTLLAATDAPTPASTAVAARSV